ncbi:MAG: sigma factor-like helix-turn-helix DNA-binding protein [Nitrososphaerales archaeon]
MNQEQHQTLIALHNGRWTSELISDDWSHVYRKLLRRYEREIVTLKISGYTEQQIARRLHVKVSTIERAIYRIKEKYRLGVNTRCDDTLRRFIWRKANGKKSKTKI